MSDAIEEFTGKYESAGRIGGALIDNFYKAVGDLFASIPQPGSHVLEVGAGDGYSTRYLKQLIPDSMFLCASELRLEGVQGIRQHNPEVQVFCQSAYQLAHADETAEVVVCLEVLEHLDSPEAALKELTRVSSGYLIVSVPREPVWRALNMARFKYWSDWGNTPGHLQHWSTASFLRFLSKHCEIVAVRQPLPWTVVLARPKQLKLALA